MEITSAINAATGAATSVLKAANQQPSLAGELISKTVETLMQAQVQQTQAPVQPVTTTAGIGSIVNTVA